MHSFWKSIINLLIVFVIACHSLQTQPVQIRDQSDPLIRFSQNSFVRPKVQLRAEMTGVTPSSTSFHTLPSYHTSLNSTSSGVHHINGGFGFVSESGLAGPTSPSSLVSPIGLIPPNEAIWSHDRNRNFSGSRKLITSPMPAKSSHPLHSTVKPESETPALNRFLTRDEWLAKEYFSYICGTS